MAYPHVTFHPKVTIFASTTPYIPKPTQYTQHIDRDRDFFLFVAKITEAWVSFEWCTGKDYCFKCDKEAKVEREKLSESKTNRVGQSGWLEVGPSLHFIDTNPWRNATLAFYCFTQQYVFSNRTWEEEIKINMLIFL